RPIRGVHTISVPVRKLLSDLSTSRARGLREDDARIRGGTRYGGSFVVRVNTLDMPAETVLSQRRPHRILAVIAVELQADHAAPGSNDVLCEHVQLLFQLRNVKNKRLSRPRPGPKCWI